MLILQRRKGESICIGEEIQITVSDTGADWVKLAIEAPKGIPILRSELKEAALENRKASETISNQVLKDLIHM